MNDLSPFYRKDEVVVGFVEMDNSKTMDSEVTWFFENHYINNVFPSFEGVAPLKWIIDKGENDGTNVSLDSVILYSLWAVIFFVAVLVSCYQSFVVS